MKHLVSRLSFGVHALLFLACLLAPAVVKAQDGEAQGGEGKTSASYGNVSYQLYCKTCHGSSGKGDGSVAEILKIPPSDLTRIRLRNGGEYPAEKIYRIIDGRGEIKAHGRDMPIWGDAFRLTEETDDEKVVVEKIQALVSYLESIQVEE